MTKTLDFKKESHYSQLRIKPIILIGFICKNLLSPDKKKIVTIISANFISFLILITCTSQLIMKKLLFYLTISTLLTLVVFQQFFKKGEKKLKGGEMTSEVRLNFGSISASFIFYSFVFLRCFERKM